MNITAEYLKTVLDYDRESGVFLWKVERNSHGGKILPGMVAGHPAKTGYVIVGLDGRIHRAHRLAWLYVYGVLPATMLDHLDGNRSNNAISNLREIDVARNAQNTHKAHRDSLSGFLGVETHRQTKGFVARICVGGKRKYLGLFPTPEEAHAVYLAAKKDAHPAWKPIPS